MVSPNLGIRPAGAFKGPPKIFAIFFGVEKLPGEFVFRHGVVLFDLSDRVRCRGN